MTLNFPASHAVHPAPPEVPLYPTTHLQSVNASLPDAELVLAGHVEHSPPPVQSLNPPASHAVHAVPSNVPLNPAKHLQSVSSSLPDAELVPAGHIEHCPGPVATLYAPASHAKQETPSEAAL